jgi:hypothetical protein
VPLSQWGVDAQCAEEVDRGHQAWMSGHVDERARKRFVWELGLRRLEQC